MHNFRYWSGRSVLFVRLISFLYLGLCVFVVLWCQTLFYLSRCFSRCFCSISPMKSFVSWRRMWSVSISCARASPRRRKSWRNGRRKMPRRIQVGDVLLWVPSLFDEFINSLWWHAASDSEDELLARAAKAQLKTRATFLTLPPEIILKIFSHLNPRDLCRAAQVCKDWNRFCLDPALWPRILPVQWARGELIECWIRHTGTDDALLSFTGNWSFQECQVERDEALDALRLTCRDDDADIDESGRDDELLRKVSVLSVFMLMPCHHERVSISAATRITGPARRLPSSAASRWIWRPCHSFISVEGSLLLSREWPFAPPSSLWALTLPGIHLNELPSVPWGLTRSDASFSD